ncbi:transcription antitermination factor NusB [candidate division KSB1 bacterium]|nr:transcription antitermination factor NusB [candidate division KSB1 bacterium]
MNIETDDEIEILTPPENRRTARERALQALYALELSGNQVSFVLKEILGDNINGNPIIEFSCELIKMTFDKRHQLDEFIRFHSKNWKFERIAVLDRIIMRMAICEFLNFGDIPPKVSIDEAIELSKLFSTDKSSGFINGILDAVYDDLKKENKINKTGRGCLDSKM